ncbi:MAG: isoleucine--tRNA ligase [Nitrospinota bacterium]|nr:isoleucine--tRNA ligase [Nitrospinota bacterium]
MDYKDTLNLPSTGFPMKANLAVKEVEILEKWTQMDLYGRIDKAGKGKKKYILHDGPPYANGNIHAGTALNKILKDIVVKSRTMAGYHSPYVPGWDCHGLPIEHAVDKKIGKDAEKLSVNEKREMCRQFADKFVNVQREEFKRLGVLADWENPYLTMNPDYEIGILRELQKLVEKGSVYRDFKPVHWCSSCKTALAEAEVEYADKTSPSIYVRFKVHNADAEKLGLSAESTYAVVWTTTPWTLPANLAISVHPDFKYMAVETEGGTLIVAEPLVESLMGAFGISDYKIVQTFAGSELENVKTTHPFLDRVSALILGTHVTMEQGTGLVHTAPGHGQDDYVVGQRYGLEVYNPVNSSGVFMEETPHVAGLHVWKANEVVIDLLKERGALMARLDISHSYPHCWRCRKPIIFRATAQWFISMTKNDLRKKSLDIIRKAQWIPKWGEERIFGMVESRPDWCISRQRVWGAPIPAFICSNCGDAILDADALTAVVDILEREGVDAWFGQPASHFMADGAKCSKCGGAEFEKSQDILDVWFDSGVSHAVAMESNPKLGWPADLYLEGSDQHRGWFHTSLLESVGVRSQAPYKAVLTHGYVVDGAGKKMSKSLGNDVPPQKIIDKYGAEIVRLWVCSEDYREDIRLSNEILSRLTEAYRKIRNTVRFMMGNISDLDADKGYIPVKERLELDRVIMIRFHKLCRRIAKAFEDYEFHVFYHGLHNFCVLDLSAFYLDIIKDRLYTFPKDSHGRRSAQSTLDDLTRGMLRLMAPVLSFTAEEAWWSMDQSGDRVSSVHMASAPAMDLAEEEQPLAAEWERILLIRGEVSAALEVARRDKVIGHSLDARVELSTFQSDYELLDKRKADLPFIFIVSQVELLENPSEGEGGFISQKAPGLTVKVRKALGAKCARCWNYSQSLGSEQAHPTVCSRCAGHLAG